MTAIVRAALAAADAGRLVRLAFADAAVEQALRSASAVDVVAVGKAAHAMLTAAISEVGSRPVRHVVGVSPQPGAGLPPDVRWFVGAHPVPDDRSVTAARAVLDIAAAARPADLFLLLLSGGASALMALPAPGLSLHDKQRASARLLAEGAEVHALNAVRKHLSAIKGGQLALAAGGAVLTLAVSDVVGDDLSAIGSGPTVPDETTFGEALDVLDQYGGRGEYPAAVVTRLTEGAAGRYAETPKAIDRRLARSSARVIGGSASAVSGARAAAEALGYHVHVVEAPVVGEARVAAGRLVDAAARARQDPATPICLLAAGELTVRVSGTGRGGRNQECALAMASDLGRLGPMAAAASVGTDGIDGPTDAAGGLVDVTTLARADAAGLGRSERALDNNDSYPYLDAIGDLIRTGPTPTNVGDLQIILVGRP